jgi:hypothetical protein
MRAGVGFAVFWALGIPVRRFFEATAAAGKAEREREQAMASKEAADNLSANDLDSSDIPGDSEE